MYVCVYVCASASAETFLNLRGDIFMRSISRTSAKHIREHERIIAVYADSNFETFTSERIYYSLIFYHVCVRILFSPVSSSISNAAFPIPHVLHFWQTVPDRKQLPNSRRVAVTWSCTLEEAFGIYNFRRSFNDRRLMHGFPYELWSSFARLLRWLGTFHRLSGAHLVFAVPSSLSLCHKAIDIDRAWRRNAALYVNNASGYLYFMQKWEAMEGTNRMYNV